ncbi:MAG: hypothetical protein JSW73_02120 [Candidatus Woesearchaeota archaeon]|nr:MAG: hypothetical protein JSW73_02120 [Candidatus Woesearchaeota archaeon]
MKEKEDYEEPWQTPGFAWRIGISMLAGIGWLCFLIIWFFFFASNFTVYQNIAILLVSILILVAILGSSWVSWGIKYGYKFEECKTKGHRKRSR